MFKERVAELRPVYLPRDPAGRTTYEAGEIAQCDLWFPPIHLPLGFGQTRRPALPPVLTEMARHLATAAKLGAPVYFCESHSPWQRGTNENTNLLLRDYFSKGVTLINHPPANLLAVEDELNHRPRMVLQDRCPADLFAALLTSNGP